MMNVQQRITTTTSSTQYLLEPAVVAACKTVASLAESLKIQEPQLSIKQLPSAAFAIPKNPKQNFVSLDDSVMDAGEDAYFVQNEFEKVVNNLLTIGIADGVGGYGELGVDSSLMSRTLMRNAKQISVHNANPKQILQQAYEKLISEKTVPAGGTTACILSIDHALRMRYANLGDSGVVVIRNNAILFKTEEQIHAFNTPFQLSIPMPNVNIINDKPQSAIEGTVQLQDGDLVLCVTDGVLDNLFDARIADTVAQLGQQADLQQIAQAICQESKKMATDPMCFTPFAKAAQQVGYYALRGGKLDDITCVVAKICKKI